MKSLIRRPITRFTQPVNSLQTSFIIRRNFTSSTTRYARSLSIIHWTMAAGVLSGFALIEVKKRQPKDSALIGPLMHWHKSIGLLMGGFIAARIGLRFMTKLPPSLEAPQWMRLAADASHATLCYVLYYIVNL